MPRLSYPVPGLRSDVRPPAQTAQSDPVIFKLRSLEKSVAFARPRIYLDSPVPANFITRSHSPVQVNFTSTIRVTKIVMLVGYSAATLTASDFCPRHSLPPGGKWARHSPQATFMWPLNCSQQAWLS